MKGIHVSSKTFGIKKIRGFWGEGIIPMLPLNNFSDFFWKKMARFVTLKKIVSNEITFNVIN